MSPMTLAAHQTSSASAPREVRDRPRRRAGRVRPTGRTGESLAPRSRPARPLAAPSLGRTAQVGSRACTGEAAAREATVLAPARRVRTGTRITDRGIAVILVTGAMIVLAAVMVVSLTAMRVTGDSYQPLPPVAAQP